MDFAAALVDFLLKQMSGKKKHSVMNSALWESFFYMGHVENGEGTTLEHNSLSFSIDFLHLLWFTLASTANKHTSPKKITTKHLMRYTLQGI